MSRGGGGGQMLGWGGGLGCRLVCCQAKAQCLLHVASSTSAARHRACMTNGVEGPLVSWLRRAYLLPSVSVVWVVLECHRRMWQPGC
jgi:hypothetical protein